MTFFLTEYAPLAPQLDPQGYEEPQLLVAVQFGDRRELWQTYKGTVTRVLGGHAVVGAGQIHASAILDPTTMISINEHAATVATCYAIFAAKEKVSGCGKETRVFALRRGGEMLAADSKAIREAEDVFREYEVLQNDNLNALLASPKRGYVSTNADARQSEIRAKLNAIEFYPPAQPKRGGISYGD